MSGRSVPVPSGRLAWLVVAGVVPVVALRPDRWWAIALVLGAVFAVAALDWARTVPPASIDVERELPATLSVGDRGELTWTVTNRSERATRVSVADALWPSLEATRRSSTFRLDAGRRHRFGAHVSPRRRGRFPFQALTVRTTAPWGLVHRQHTRDLAGTVAVLPAHPSRDELTSRLRVPLETGLRSVRQRGTGTDFDQLREYRPGDDIRRVDWAATARQQRAIVREYRAERNQHVVALLDNGRAMAGTVGDAPRVEHAMDAVLGLARVATAIGDNVGLVTFDQQVRGIVPAGNGRAQFGRVAEALYLLDTSYGESAYRAAFTTAASRFRRRALIVVFTELVESTVVESLLPAIRVLTRTHLVMVAAVRDPTVASWAAGTSPAARSTGGARPAATGVERAYRSAAAVASLDGRDRAAAVLVAGGVIVVDARPGELATGVVDRYLELKAAGRL